MRMAIRAGLIAVALSLGVVQAAPVVTRSVLPNGLTVLIAPAEHGQIAGVELLLKVGMIDEPEGMRGARVLLQQIVVNDSHAQFNADLAPASAFVNPRTSGLGVNTDWDFVEVGLATDADELGIGLAMIARHVFGVTLDAERLDEARTLVGRSFDLSHQSPVQTTFELFRQALFGRGPLGEPLQGDPKTLAAIDLEALQAFRDAYYVPGNAILCVATPQPVEEVLASVRAVFEAAPAAPVPESPPLPAPPTESLVEVGESADLVQASLVVGMPLPPYGDPLFPAAQMIAELLEGRGGRLRRDLSLLQTLGLAIPTRLLEEHYPISTLPIPISQRPFLAVHALCSPNTIERTREGLLRHLLELRTRTVADAELARARQRAINHLLVQHAAPVDLATILARRELFGVGDLTAGITAFEAVTAEDLKTVATQYFGRHAIGVQMPAI